MTVWQNTCGASALFWYPTESSREGPVLNLLQFMKLLDPLSAWRSRSGKPNEPAPIWCHCAMDRAKNQSQLCFHAVSGAYWQQSRTSTSGSKRTCGSKEEKRPRTSSLCSMLIGRWVSPGLGGGALVLLSIGPTRCSFNLSSDWSD